MNKLKVASIVGARPQFIKLKGLHHVLDKYLDHIIIHTGQHYDYEMSEVFFKDLQIPKPIVSLNIKENLHGRQTGKMLIALEEEIINIKPRIVIVYGDTNTTLAGALACTKLDIPVIHLESGLRSYNRSMPEEINRITVDHISDFLFVPTKIAMDNLLNEGLIERSFLTGDIMVDALKISLEKAKNHSDIINNLNLINENYYLLTLHRPYNVDNPNMLKCILESISKLDDPIIFPVHPRTKKILENNSIYLPSIFSIIEPLGYLDFINLQYFAKKIITDSGGIQKEAYMLGRPCITLRTETEWMETVNEGWNLLLDPLNPELAEEISKFNPRKKQADIFGNEVAIKMLNVIKSVL